MTTRHASVLNAWLVGSRATAFLVDGNTEHERPATHLTVLDVFLLADGMIDDDGNRLSAVGAIQRLFG